MGSNPTRCASRWRLCRHTDAAYPLRVLRQNKGDPWGVPFILAWWDEDLGDLVVRSITLRVKETRKAENHLVIRPGF